MFLEENSQTKLEFKIFYNKNEVAEIECSLYICLQSKDFINLFKLGERIKWYFYIMKFSETSYVRNFNTRNTFVYCT